MSIDEAMEQEHIMRNKRVVEPTQPREVNVNNEAMCVIARHGTETLQGASFSYIVSLTSEDFDLSLREEIARKVHKMIAFKGSFDQWTASRFGIR